MTRRQYLQSYVVTSSGCWNFVGYIYPKGYGRAGSHGYAHRYFYRSLVGPIPAGLEIDHLCSNRRCVNPEHLEPVTHQENVRRASERRMFCGNGHELSGANLSLDRSARRCKRCRTDYARSRRAQLRSRPAERAVSPHGT